MKKRAVVLATSLLLTMSSPLVALADSLEQDINNADTNIQNLKEKKQSAEKILQSLESEIASLDEQVTQTLNKKIKLEKKLNTIHQQIDELTRVIKKRSQKIAEQARSTQINQSNGSYLEVVLESENISDAITRSFALGKLMKANNDIIEKQRNDQVLLAKKTEEVNQSLAEISKITQDLKAKQADLTEKKFDQAILAKQVAADLAKEEGKKASLLKEKEQAEARKVAAAKAAKEKAAVEERIKAEAAKQTEQISVESVNTQAAPPLRQGEFQRPIPSIQITSGFGTREDPTGSSGNSHDGLDMAGSLNQPIFASRNGQVAATGFDPSAGNYVIIKHDNGMYTNYFHLNRIGTTTGAEVSTGEVIGFMGTTGNSTGVHLHFGISTALWSGYLDPGPYLGLY